MTHTVFNTFTVQDLSQDNSGWSLCELHVKIDPSTKKKQKKAKKKKEYIKPKSNRLQQIKSNRFLLHTSL